MQEQPQMQKQEQLQSYMSGGATQEDENRGGDLRG